MSNEMPVIDLSQLLHLTERETSIVKRILGKGNALRASRPSVPEQERRTVPGAFLGYEYYHKDAEGDLAGEAAYVWRMVCFYVSPKKIHQCTPVTCEFGLSGSMAERRARAKELDRLVDQIVDTVPPKQRHGLNRWANAFGLSGSPQFNDEGAIIYR